MEAAMRDQNIAVRIGGSLCRPSHVATKQIAGGSVGWVELHQGVYARLRGLWRDPTFSTVARCWVSQTLDPTYKLPRPLLRRLTACDGVPPGAHAGHLVVVAVDHVDRLAQPGGGGLDANGACLDALLRRHPHAVVPPHAGTPGDLLAVPVVHVDHTAAPAVFHHEAGRRVRIEGGDLVVDVAAERDADTAFLAERQVIALAHVVEIVELDHQMVGGAAAGLDEGDRVVARIGVEEIGVERPQHVIGEAEAQHVAIERHRVVDVLYMQHHVAHAERTGAEA